jgi:hypothetical protein
MKIQSSSQLIIKTGDIRKPTASSQNGQLRAKGRSQKPKVKRQSPEPKFQNQKPKKRGGGVHGVYLVAPSEDR